MERTVYERYGGFSQVSRVVLDFYNRLLEDDEYELVSAIYDELFEDLAVVGPEESVR